MEIRKYDKSLFWNIYEVLSYNALYNFILSIRGGGKTYGSLKYCIDRFKATRNRPEGPSRFMYLRRYKSELQKLTTMKNGRIFDKVKQEFPEDQLSAKSDVLYCNGEVMGYAQALTTASQLKSDACVNVEFIIFDEFIINTSKSHLKYLNDEVTIFLELYETLSRGEIDIRVFFLANAVSVSNPYFDYWHLDKPRDKEFQRFHDDILVQFVRSSELSEIKKKTRFGKLISGTEYSDYAYSNEWLLDNTDFIERKPQRARYYCTLLYNDSQLGVWCDNKDYRFYISEDIDTTWPRIFAITTDDHKPNIMLFRRAKKISCIKEIMEAYDIGVVYYETLKLKSWFKDIMRMVRV